MSQHKPIRCFDGNAQPYEPFWRFVDAAASQSGQTEMELYGVISEYSWLGDEVTPQKFKNDLYAFGKGGPVLLKIDSPGGDVIAASTMRAIMTDYPGEITVRVDGMAASAAVIVAIAGKTVKMMDSAYMMIHDPAVVVFMAQLDIELLGKLRDDLKAIKDGIVPAYATRTGQSEDKIARMMTNETWMSAREAVDLGFADEIITGGQKPAGITNLAYVNAMQSYAHVPPALMQANQSVNIPADQDSSEPEWTADMEREAQSLRDFVSLWK